MLLFKQHNKKTYCSENIKFFLKKLERLDWFYYVFLDYKLPDLSKSVEKTTKLFYNVEKLLNI